MNNLYRSRQNRMIAGVAGGMAEYADFDATLMRFIWILAFFAGGVGFLAYIICWIIIPEGSTDHAAYPTNYNEAGLATDVAQQKAARHRNAGLFLIGLGLIFLAKNLVPWQYWDKAWPLLLVAVGLYILLGNRKGEQ